MKAFHSRDCSVITSVMNGLCCKRISKSTYFAGGSACVPFAGVLEHAASPPKIAYIDSLYHLHIKLRAYLHLYTTKRCSADDST
jgi:hypothetical protein